MASSGRSRMVRLCWINVCFLLIIIWKGSEFVQRKTMVGDFWSSDSIAHFGNHRYYYHHPLTRHRCDPQISIHDTSLLLAQKLRLDRQNNSDNSGPSPCSTLNCRCLCPMLSLVPPNILVIFPFDGLVMVAPQCSHSPAHPAFERFTSVRHVLNTPRGMVNQPLLRDMAWCSRCERTGNMTDPGPTVAEFGEYAAVTTVLKQHPLWYESKFDMVIW